MARSSKKGPFVDEYLLKKVEALQKSGKKEIIKTWSRRSTIYPAFVEQTFAVYNGHEHITVEDQFSTYCREYLVAGGFSFHGREVLFV